MDSKNYDKNYILLSIFCHKNHWTIKITFYISLSSALFIFFYQIQHSIFVIILVVVVFISSSSNLMFHFLDIKSYNSVIIVKFSFHSPNLPWKRFDELIPMKHDRRLVVYVGFVKDLNFVIVLNEFYYSSSLIFVYYNFEQQKVSPWFEPDPVCPDPSVLVNFRLVNLFQPFKNIWLRYFGVVNVYSNGLTAEFNGSTNTTKNA